MKDLPVLSSADSTDVVFAAVRSPIRLIDVSSFDYRMIVFDAHHQLPLCTHCTWHPTDQIEWYFVISRLVTLSFVIMYSLAMRRGCSF